jgi:hypothetical protein
MSEEPKQNAALFEELNSLRQRVLQLAESEEKWRSLAEHSPDHIMVLDLEGTITFLNHPAPGVKREEAIGVRSTITSRNRSGPR